MSEVESIFLLLLNARLFSSLINIGELLSLFFLLYYTVYISRNTNILPKMIHPP